MSDPRVTDILATIQTYLDGLWEGDTKKLAAAFHPDAHLYSATGGKLVNIGQADWYKLVESRPSPKANGQGREHDRILNVDITGPNTAVVKVNCAILPRVFTDYLSLILIDGKWRIISKTYHFETQQAS